MNLEFRNRNTASFWNKLLFKKNKTLVKSQIYKDKIDNVLRMIRRYEGEFLDIGFGRGNLETKIIKEKLNIEIYGVDISPKAVKNAEKELKGFFYVSNIFKLPFNKYFFDIVAILDVLEHIEKDRIMVALKEVARVLKKGGRLVISIPLNENLETLVKEGENYNAHMREYTYDILAKELKNADFRIIDKKFLYAFAKYYKLKTFLMNFFPWLRKPNLLIVNCIKK